MGNEHSEKLENRRDISVDVGGTVHCFPCYRALVNPSADPEVTGQRLGNERCANCGHTSHMVLEVEANRGGGTRI